MDYWNRFDGMCYEENGNLFFIQIKTNKWESEKKLLDFMENRWINVVILNVTPKGVKTRLYFKALNGRLLNI